MDIHMGIKAMNNLLLLLYPGINVIVTGLFAGILQPQLGAWLITIIVLNTLGVLAVVGVAIYSGWKLIQRQGTSSLLWANVLILAGDLINAAAGTTARLGVKNIFWLVMTFGWIVFFIGVLLASRPRRHAVTQNETSKRRMSAPDAVSHPH